MPRTHLTMLSEITLACFQTAESLLFFSDSNNEVRQNQSDYEAVMKQELYL